MRDSVGADLGVVVDREAVLLHIHALAEMVHQSVAALLADLQAVAERLELEGSLFQDEELGGEDVHLRGA
jgi:hypothetical protein